MYIRACGKQLLNRAYYMDEVHRERERDHSALGVEQNIVIAIMYVIIYQFIYVHIINIKQLPYSPPDSRG